jgi:transglutaminase-like putative cysteine protease
MGTREGPRFGAALGATAAVLAVLALPSLPTRIPASLVLALGGIVVVRHVRQPGVGLVLIGVWALATLLALVLIDRADIDERPRLAGGPPLPVVAGETARSMLVLVAVVLVVGSLLVPVLGQRRPAELGAGGPAVDLFGGSSSTLSQQNSLDTTVRPNLGNEVVMTVTASRPAFWRGETFDQWNGSSWTRSDEGYAALPRVGESAVVSPTVATPTSGGRLLTQTFHLEASYADVLFAAAEPVRVEPGFGAVERPDGTLLTSNPLGRGASYRVVSRTPDATEATLRAANANAVPIEITATYAQPPFATDRVRALAAKVTAGRATTYDKVRALEAWMDRNTKYSLDARVSRQSPDVVDDFLFNVREGWCEQIASSLVVMLRTLGIPARLATGFVPGNRSRLTGEFVVRAKHAHAWTEVFFAGVGWQAFDPTAGVPLAGEARASESLWSWLVHHALAIAIVLALGVLCFTGVSALRDLVARRRRHRARSWAARRFDDLEQLGSEAGRVRRPSETAPEYAAALAGVLGEADLRAVGTAIAADAFSPAGLAADERAAVDAVLAGVTAKRSEPRSLRER